MEIKAFIRDVDTLYVYLAEVLIDLGLCCGCYLDCPLGLLSNEGGGRGWGKGC